MSEGVKQYMTFKLDKNVAVTQKTKCVIDKNWSFGIKQSFDSGKLATKKEYDIGFSMTYKLWTKDKWHASQANSAHNMSGLGWFCKFVITNFAIFNTTKRLAHKQSYLSIVV